jgi:casein kinase II subunit beta
MFVFGEIIAKSQKAPHKKRRYSFEMSSSSEWIREFTVRNDWLVVVDDDYLNDSFNHFGLHTVIDDYTTLIKLIRGQFYDFDDTPRLERRAEALYGLIHARYLLTFNGAKEMRDKFEKQLFGNCPRVACKNQPLLPIGVVPMPGEMKTKTFCPCCADIYESTCNLDGSFFGPYFPHFFLQSLKHELKIPESVPTPLSICGVPIDPGSPLFRGGRLHS